MHPVSVKVSHSVFSHYTLASKFFNDPSLNLVQIKNQSHLKVLIMGFSPLISKSMEQVLNKPSGDEDQQAMRNNLAPIVP